MGGGGFLNTVLTGGGLLPDPLDISGAGAREQAEQTKQAAQLSSDAAIAAAQIQERTAEKALAETQRQYDVTRGDQLPNIDTGHQALAQQRNLTGLEGQTAQQQAFNEFNESPGQAWLRNRTMQGVLNNASATGSLGGGNTKRALQANAAGLASQEYGQHYNRLAGLSGTGQQSASNIGALGAQQSGLASNLMMAGGQAAASGQLGSAQARASGLQQQAQMGAAQTQSNVGLAGAGLSALMMFSDINLKKDISEFTESDLKSCYDTVVDMEMFNWKYREETNLPDGYHMGPMYQNAPNCIKTDNKEFKALDVHKEMMLLAGALKYAHMQNKLTGGV